MKKKEAIVIFALVAIMVIVLIVVIAKRGKNNEIAENNEQQGQNNTVVKEFVTVQEDGTKVNTSNKLSETKTFDGYEISNITLTEKGNESYIRATVKNTTSEKKGDELITLTIIDKDGNTLAEVNGYLDTMEAGSSSILSIKASADFANAYNFKVSK